MSSAPPLGTLQVTASSFFPTRNLFSRESALAMRTPYNAQRAIVRSVVIQMELDGENLVHDLCGWLHV
jgi:hypothetical protein